MKNYIEIFINSFIGSSHWIWKQITLQVNWHDNFFYGVILISLVIWLLEIVFPWRKNQKIFRKDFWLDGFYIFFNMFIFSIAISGLYAILNQLYHDFGMDTDALQLFNLTEQPLWLQLTVFFVLTDFVQWFTHILLHRYRILWNFHQVHHSVQEMGFAAHFRYHWMENVLYKPLKTLAVMIIGGFEPNQAFIIHFVSITIGHLNHANIKLTYGPLKYILNNPVMHLWHHAKELPKEHPHGINFGISLSIWDYIFKTGYIPEDSGTIALGFDKVEQFPKSFWSQFVHGFGSTKDHPNTPH